MQTVYQKARVGLKKCQTVREIKPVALVVVKLCFSEGISQVAMISYIVSQSVEKQIL